MYKVLTPTSERIRPLPYPYKAAISISNDIEYFTPAFFEEFNRFLNTNQETKFGRGLSLEVTQSLFFFSHSSDSLAYFANTDTKAPKSKFAHRLDDYLRANWIDTNHSFGDFADSDDFKREHAERSYEALAMVGAELPIFTVHGGYSNTQTIGPGFEHHKGDRPGTAQYHTDLFQKANVRFIWSDCGKMIDELPMLPKSGGRLEQKPPLPPPPLLWPFRGKKAIEQIPPLASLTRENLFVDYTLQDGQSFRGFKRYRATGAYAPNLSSFLSQVRSIDWHGMYDNFGFHVIYQHLGVLAKTAQGIIPATIDNVCAAPELYLTPFHFLAKQNSIGDLWVPGLYRFLQYADMAENVVIDFSERSEAKIQPTAHQVQNPENFYAGLTVYTDPKQDFRLTYNGAELPLRQNGPDKDGQYSVTVPIKPLADIW